MKIRWQRLNIYLLATALAAVAGGCRSPNEPNPKKLLSTLRLHLEANRSSTTATEPVPVFRERPIMVNVESLPFLTESNVLEAKVVDGVGGFALRVKFDDSGASFLETCTAGNRGRKIAIFSQFGDKILEKRWLAAPVVSRRITDGVFTFTPDATREEAEEIALGLNNVSKKVHTWVDR